MVHSIHKQYYQYIAMWHALKKKIENLFFKVCNFSHDIAHISSQ